MFRQLIALGLLAAVTLSLGVINQHVGFFPFMLPVALLIVSARVRVDGIAACLLLISTAATVSAAVTGASFAHAILWGALCALYLVARWQIIEILTPRAVAAAVAILILLLAGLSLYQLATSSNAGSPYALFSESMRIGMIETGDGLVRRPVGVFHNSNILGQWVVYATFLILPLFSRLPRRTRPVIMLASACVLAITYSRAVWAIAICAGIFLALRWLNRTPRRLGTGLLVMGVGGLVALISGATFTFMSRFLPERIEASAILENISQREALNVDGTIVALENPITGVGYLQYSGQVVAGVQNLRPHNVFVQVAAEQGIFTLLALTACVLATAVKCFRSAREVRAKDTWLAISLVGVPLSWVGFMFVYSSAADYAVLPLLMFTVGYLLAMAQAAEAREATAMGVYAAPTSTPKRSLNRALAAR